MRIKGYLGQALVETAIIAPILVFLLIGVWEVGWALRGYLVLANANREAARFAVRPGYLDFSEESYQRIYNHALNSLSGQIPFTSTGVMIVSYLKVEAECGGVFTITTPIEVPTYTWTYPITATVQTRLDYAQLGQELAGYQRDYVCWIENAGYRPFDNEMVIVEMFFYQKQLFGFPIISNPLTDPVPMYTHSAFRKLRDRTSE